MNLRWLMTIALCGAMVLSVQVNCPAGDGWFGSSKAPAANGVTSTGTKKSWLPTWSKTTKTKAKTTSSKQSMLGSMTKGTKKAWNNTTSFLNPFDNPPKPAPKADSSPNSSGWFSSKKDEKKQVNSVPDFITQDKPKW